MAEQKKVRKSLKDMVKDGSKNRLAKKAMDDDKKLTVSGFNSSI